MRPVAVVACHARFLNSGLAPALVAPEVGKETAASATRKANFVVARAR